MAGKVIKEIAKAGLTADKQKMAATKTTSAKGKKTIGGPFGIFRLSFSTGGMPKAKPN